MVRTNSNTIEELLGITRSLEKKIKPQIQINKKTTAKKVNIDDQKRNISKEDSRMIKETVADFHADKLANYPPSTRKPLTFWQWLKSLFGF